MQRLFLWGLRRYIGGPARSWVFSSLAVLGFRAAKSVLGRRELIDVGDIKSGQKIVIESLPISHKKQIRVLKADDKAAKKAGKTAKKAGKAAKKDAKKAKKAGKAAKRDAKATKKAGKAAATSTERKVARNATATRTAKVPRTAKLSRTAKPAEQKVARKAKVVRSTERKVARKAKAVRSNATAANAGAADD